MSHSQLTQHCSPTIEHTGDWDTAELCRLFEHKVMWNSTWKYSEHSQSINEKDAILCVAEAPMSGWKGGVESEDAGRTRNERRKAILEKCWAVYLLVIEAEVRRWGNWPPSLHSATAAAAKWVTSRQTAFMSHNHTHIHMHFLVTWCLWWMLWGYNALQQRKKSNVPLSTLCL